MMTLATLAISGMLLVGGEPYQHQKAPPATGRKREEVLNTPRMIRNGVMEPTETEKLEKAQEMLDVLRRNGKLGHDHRQGSGYGYDRGRDWESRD